jgi:hypothetical protein
MKTRASILLCLLALCGCRSIGPHTIPRDRYDYSGSISDSWKNQMLLNIVKLRYMDPPIFVDVGQIVAGYSLETSGSMGGQISSAGAAQGNSIAFGGAAKYTDRPTITYTPLTGDKFVRGLMTPLPPEQVLFTIQSGWPAEAILFITVARLNGLGNQHATINGLGKADPRFLRLLELFRDLQEADAVGMRVQTDPQKQKSTLVTFRARGVSPEAIAKGQELRELLGLAPDVNEFNLAFGGVAANDREVAMQTRSLLQILGILSAQVEVPPDDVAKGKASPGFLESHGEAPSSLRLVHILCSKSRPADAYVTVFYRDHWFWIADTDLKSKRTFAVMMMLFTLADTGVREAPPVLTIPTQ